MALAFAFQGSVSKLPLIGTLLSHTQCHCPCSDIVHDLGDTESPKGLLSLMFTLQSNNHIIAKILQHGPNHPSSYTSETFLRAYLESPNFLVQHTGPFKVWPQYHVPLPFPSCHHKVYTVQTDLTLLTGLSTTPYTLLCLLYIPPLSYWIQSMFAFILMSPHVFLTQVTPTSSRTGHRTWQVLDK